MSYPASMKGHELEFENVVESDKRMEFFGSGTCEKINDDDFAPCERATLLIPFLFG